MFSNAKYIVNHLERKINPNLTATTVDENILSSNENILRQKLSYWLDNDDHNNNSPIYKDIKLLMKKVDQQTLKSNQLQLLVDFFQKVRKKTIFFSLSFFFSRKINIIIALHIYLFVISYFGGWEHDLFRMKRN